MQERAVADRGASQARVGTSDDLERYRLLSEVRASWESFGLSEEAAATGQKSESGGAQGAHQTRLLRAIEGAGQHGLSLTEQKHLFPRLSAERIAKIRESLEAAGLIVTHHHQRSSVGAPRRRPRTISYVLHRHREEGDAREVLTHLHAYSRRADWIMFRLIPQLGPAEQWFDSLWALYDAMDEWAKRTGRMVAEARAKGAGWDEIGDALGIDAESAYKRLYWLSSDLEAGSRMAREAAGRQGV